MSFLYERRWDDWRKESKTRLQVEEELAEKNKLLQKISMAAASDHSPAGDSARKRADATRRCDGMTVLVLSTSVSNRLHATCAC